jgi:hypothetical protein
MKQSILLCLLIFPLLGLAQSDSNKNQLAITSKEADIENTSINDKGKLYISGGIGYSTILPRVYSFFVDQQAAAYGISESAVWNGNIDYGIGNTTDIGLGIAYQTATGAPAGTNYFLPSPYTERLTRLNISARFLKEIIEKKHIELYFGLRAGISFWTDFVSPPPPVNSTAQPTLGKSRPIYPSIQAPFGIRYFVGHLGLQAELAIGTPYFAEGGITFSIGKHE